MDGILTGLTLLAETPLAIVAVIGMVCGIFGGAMPGVSPSITMALLLPFTYTMEPVAALVLLTAVYIGSEYAASIPAILIRTPGSNGAAATLIEGYEMQRQGRGGEALGISLVASVIGAVCGLALLILLTEPLTRLALAFTPASYAGLGILGLSVIATVSGGSLTKGVIAACMGLALATVGTDPVSGVPRFSYGSAQLLSGLSFLIVMIGLFAVSEVLAQAAERVRDHGSMKTTRIRFPSFGLQKKLFRSNFIGVGVGTFCGVMPGAGGTVAAFMAYNEAKRFSRNKEQFGKGAPEGVAATESAVNSDSCVGLLPLLSFGIPASNSTAILLGAFLIHGLQPGPVLFSSSPELLYGIYTGMIVALIALPLMAILTLKLCITMVNQPKAYLSAFILALVFSGVYTVNNSLLDLSLVLVFGIIGFGMRFFGVPLLPMVLGLVLGYMVESNYRRALVISGGDHSIFLEDTFSAIFLALAALFLAVSLFTELRGQWQSRGRPSDAHDY